MELTKNISQSKLIKTVFAIILGSIALTISAKIKIPFYPVPMTMQPFVVLFLGVSLGFKIGLASKTQQELTGINHPLYGGIFKNEIETSPAQIRSKKYLNLFEN